MSNTLSSNLIVDIISNDVTTTLGNKCRVFRSFSRDFSDDPVRMPGNGKGTTVQSALATAAEAVQENATDFEGGATTIANKPIAVSQYTQRMQLTNAERRSGYRLVDQLGINMNSLLDKLIDVMLTPVTLANFGTTAVVDKTAADFGAADVKTIRAEIAKANRKILMLHPDWYTKLLPTTLEHIRIQDNGGAGFAGFDEIHEITRWDGAGANIVGFAGDPQALGMVARLPEIPSEAANLMDTEVMLLEEAGLNIQVNTWFATGSRNTYHTFDVLFGAAQLDGEAARCITDGS